MKKFADPGPVNNHKVQPVQKKIMLLLAILFGIYSSSSAATYYFSGATGSDQYTILQARNPTTPWKSLAKLNAVFPSLSGGDSVLFKRGETFYGAITVSRAGSVFAPIYFGAYGHGVQPHIDGFTNLINWKQIKHGVYATYCDVAGTDLLINGKEEAMGRYPNSGYLTYQSHNDNTSIAGAPLAENFAGAEVVIRKNRWVIDKSPITAQSGGTITYTPTSNAVPNNNYGYFIQKSLKTLDQFGEWYYDEANKCMYVYFGDRAPSSFVVKTSAAGNLVDIRRGGYVTFEDICFTGSGANTFNIVQSKKVVIKNCSIRQSGADAVFANYSPFVTVDNCIIDHAQSGGINIDAGCANSVIVNNYIKNIGLHAGMGKSGTGTYEGITSFADNTHIEKNRIDSVGYNGIYFGGTDSYAKNNYITYFCLTKDDGAGIYIGDWTQTVNKKVIGNIVLHGIGNSAGTNYPSLQAEGIYIDDNSQSVTITDNTVSLCANNGIKIHNAKNIAIYNNTVINNGVQLRLEQDHYIETSSFIRNNDIRNNTFVSTNSRQSAARFSSHQDDISSFGQLENNFYSKASGKSEAIVANTVKNGHDVKQKYSLSNWQSAYGKDGSSTEVAADEKMVFEYNASSSAKTISLNRSYVDVHNNVYTGKITISPYSSIYLVSNDARVVKGGQARVLASR